MYGSDFAGLFRRDIQYGRSTNDPPGRSLLRAAMDVQKRAARTQSSWRCVGARGESGESGGREMFLHSLGWGKQLLVSSWAWE